ncbi:hypothetical protein [Halorubrum trueperi]|uniref:Uncharacterized protein n=1 Tax=Halorubrum trueperi TaxID=2004704 RepID=A0ABD5ULA1_9EURY
MNEHCVELPTRGLEDDRFGHAANEVERLPEAAKPGRLVGRVSDLGLWVSKEGKREVVRVLPRSRTVFGFASHRLAAGFAVPNR